MVQYNEYPNFLSMLHTYLKQALDLNASDIFLTAGAKPAFKILGKVQFQEDLPVLTQEDIENYLVELTHSSAKDFFKKEKDLDFGVSIAGLSRFRVNASMTGRGGALVFRPIKSEIPALDTLSVPVNEFLKFTEYSNGIILFTGTMGSGKSTSMASIIDYINENYQKHIVTIEDPIEYQFQNKKSLVDQREIPEHSHSFFKALRGSFREAVDVLLLGEMRDLETMSLAMTAAETGALVFSTLHTAGAIHAIDRIIDAFPADRQQQIRVQLSQVLRAVVWQSLIPNKDGDGVVPAVEIMFNNHAIAHLIRKGQTYQIRSILETSKAEGMITMEKAIENLMLEGKVNDKIGEEYLLRVKRANLSLDKE